MSLGVSHLSSHREAQGRCKRSAARARHKTLWGCAYVKPVGVHAELATWGGASGSWPRRQARREKPRIQIRRG